MKYKSTDFNQTINLMILTGFTKIFGFLREIFFANIFGTQAVADSYKIVLQIPTLILTFIGIGVSTGLIPIYTKIGRNQDNNHANEFLNNILNLLLIITFLFIIFIEINPSIFINIFASGFKYDSRLIIAIRILRVSIFSIIGSVIIFIFTPYFQLNKLYFIPVLITIPMNILYIVSFKLYSFFGEIILSYGIILAIFSQVLLIIPFIKKTGFRWKASINLKDKNIMLLLELVAPITIGVAVQQLNNIIDKSMASNIAIGGLSTLDYANKLIYFIFGIAVTSLISVIYPKLSQLYEKNDFQNFIKIYINSIILLLIIVIPAFFMFTFFSNEIITVVFKRGKFLENDVIITSLVLKLYGFSLIPLAIREIVIRVFYCMGNSKTPTINSLAAVGLNIMLNIYLGKLLGIYGLALATSLSLFICTIFLVIDLNKTNLKPRYKIIIIPLLKVIVSCIVMVFLSKLLFYFIQKHLTYKLSILISFILGFFAYLLILFLISRKDIFNVMKSFNS